MGFRDSLLAAALACVPALHSDGRWLSLAIVATVAIVWRDPRLALVLLAYWIPTAIGMPWPASCFALALAWAAVRHPPWQTGSRRRLNASGVVASVAVGSAAGAIVVLLAHDQVLGGLWIPMERPSAVVLASVATLAALANALGEEIVWRAYLVAGARESPIVVQVVLVALSFGVAHQVGLPGGWVGSIAAAGYGAVLMFLRLRWGFSAAFLAHAVTDTLIFVPLALTASFAFASH